MKSEKLLKAESTILGARREELVEVAIRLAILEVQHRLGKGLPPEAYEHVACVVLGGYIEEVRGRQTESRLAALDHSKMSVN